MGLLTDFLLPLAIKKGEQERLDKEKEKQKQEIFNVIKNVLSPETRNVPIEPIAGISSPEALEQGITSPFAPTVSRETPATKETAFKRMFEKPMGLDALKIVAPILENYFPITPPEGMELSGITHKGYSYRKPEVKEPKYSSIKIETSDILDIPVDKVTGQDILKAKGLLKSVGEPDFDLKLWNTAGEFAYKELGGSAMMGIPENAEQLWQKTEDLYKKLKEKQTSPAPATTQPTGTITPSPYPEYPDAFQEGGVWKVIRDGKKYKIED